MGFIIAEIFDALTFTNVTPLFHEFVTERFVTVTLGFDPAMVAPFLTVSKVIPVIVEFETTASIPSSLTFVTFRFFTEVLSPTRTNHFPYSFVAHDPERIVKFERMTPFCHAFITGVELMYHQDVRPPLNMTPSRLSPIRAIQAAEKFKCPFTPSAPVRI